MKKISFVTVRARQLRQKSTEAEELLWERVRNRQIGWKIVRQKPIIIDYFGKKRAFIADFYCSEKNAIIELDGNIHLKQSDYDSLRTLLLNQKGIRLIRFANKEITGDVKNVLSRIRVFFESTPASLSTGGEGKTRSVRGEAKGNGVIQ